MLTCRSKGPTLARSSDAGEGISSSPPNDKHGAAPRCRPCPIADRPPPERCHDTTTASQHAPPSTTGGPHRLPLLPCVRTFLLDLPPMRFRHVPGLYGREFLGAFLQRHYVGVSGLWCLQWLRQPVVGFVKRPISALCFAFRRCDVPGVRLTPQLSHALILDV